MIEIALGMLLAIAAGVVAPSGRTAACAVLIVVAIDLISKGLA